MAEVACRYLLAAERQRRKPSTIQNKGSEVRVHLAPFFADRSMDGIPEDVADLISSLDATAAVGDVESLRRCRAASDS